MKFLHTADWHIGLKAAHLGAAGARVRGERLSAARRVISAANERGVDFVVLAGDVFDDNGVGAAAVKEVVSILEASNAPVYIIPGNHDYLCPGSVWEFGEWGSGGKIRVLTENVPVDIGGAVLFPCPVKVRDSVYDPTAWIPVDESTDKIRIAIAHGSVEGLPKEELDFPIARNVAESKKLDYVILGHWHSFSLFGGDKNCRMAYSGSHETNKFGKPDSGCAAVVTVDKRGSMPVIERIDTGGLTWIDMREKVDGGETVRAVMESILGIDNQGSTLVKLELSGVINISDIGALNDLRAIGESGRFLYFAAITDDLRMISGDISTDTGWIAAIDETVVRKTGERIVNMLTDANLRSGTDKEVLERALLELYMLNGGVRK